MDSLISSKDSFFYPKHPGVTPPLFHELYPSHPDGEAKYPMYRGYIALRLDVVDEWGYKIKAVHVVSRRVWDEDGGRALRRHGVSLTYSKMDDFMNTAFVNEAINNVSSHGDLSVLREMGVEAAIADAMAKHAYKFFNPRKAFSLVFSIIDPFSEEILHEEVIEADVPESLRLTPDERNT